MDLVLASASERRKELLKRLTRNFDVVISNFDEDAVEFRGSCSEYVKTLSKCKAVSVGNQYLKEAVVIGVDTIVAIDGRILGKPRDTLEAFNMLKTLSGKVHQVYSGITVYNTATKELLSDYVSTDVKFSVLGDEDIRRYIYSKEPQDDVGGCDSSVGHKTESHVLSYAGAYGIQGYGGVFVEEIQGCYYNIVGLPLNKLRYMIKEMGVNL
jgi:septum formation protein